MFFGSFRTFLCGLFSCQNIYYLLDFIYIYIYTIFYHTYIFYTKPYINFILKSTLSRQKEYLLSFFCTIELSTKMDEEIYRHDLRTHFMGQVKNSKLQVGQFIAIIKTAQ